MEHYKFKTSIKIKLLNVKIIESSSFCIWPRNAKLGGLSTSISIKGPGTPPSIE